MSQKHMMSTRLDLMDELDKARRLARKAANATNDDALRKANKKIKKVSIHLHNLGIDPNVLSSEDDEYVSESEYRRIDEIMDRSDARQHFLHTYSGFVSNDVEEEIVNDEIYVFDPEAKESELDAKATRLRVFEPSALEDRTPMKSKLILRNSHTSNTLSSQQQKKKQVEQLPRGVNHPPPPAPALPNTVSSASHDLQLMPHQLECLEFVLERTKAGLSSGIFHAPGNGKTATCTKILDGMNLPKGSLVLNLTPKALGDMWSREYNFWSSNPMPTFGPVPSGGAQMDSFISSFMCTGGMLIVPFKMFSTNVDKFQKCPIRVLIIDEVHLLKNEKSKIFAAVNSIRKNAANVIVLALSGTPIQNTTMDLFNVLQLVQPGELGNVDVFKKLMLAEKDVDVKKLRICTNTIHSMIQKVTHIRGEECMVVEGNKVETYLYFDGGEQVKAIKDDGNIKTFKQCHDTLDASKENRMRLVVSILMFCKQKNIPVIAFSQRINFVTDLHQMFEDTSLLLTGDVTKKAQELVDQFQNDPSKLFFFATQQAGGVGLTLTKAQVVILCDIMWNPTRDSQAIARVYRKGLTHDIRVYRLVCNQSVELRMQRQATFKMSRNASVTNDVDSNDIYKLDDLFQKNPNNSNLEEIIQLPKDHEDDIFQHLLNYEKDIFLHAVDSSTFTRVMDETITPFERFRWKNEYYASLFYSDEYHMDLSILGIDCNPLMISHICSVPSGTSMVYLRTRPYPNQFVQLHIAVGENDLFDPSKIDVVWTPIKSDPVEINFKSVKDPGYVTGKIDKDGNDEWWRDELLVTLDKEFSQKFISFKVTPIWSSMGGFFASHQTIPRHEASSAPTTPVNIASLEQKGVFAQYTARFDAREN